MPRELVVGPHQAFEFRLGTSTISAGVSVTTVSGSGAPVRAAPAPSTPPGNGAPTIVVRPSGNDRASFTAPVQSPTMRWVRLSRYFPLLSCENGRWPRPPQRRRVDAGRDILITIAKSWTGRSAAPRADCHPAEPAAIVMQDRQATAMNVCALIAFIPRAYRIPRGALRALRTIAPAPAKRHCMTTRLPAGRAGTGNDAPANWEVISIVLIPLKR